MTLSVACLLPPSKSFTAQQRGTPLCCTVGLEWDCVVRPVLSLARLRGLTFSRWGCDCLCLRQKLTELANTFFFYSAVVSVSVFAVLSTAFRSINSLDNSPLSYSVLLVLFLPSCSFNYISLYESLLSPNINCSIFSFWLTGLKAPPLSPSLSVCLSLSVSLCLSLSLSLSLSLRGSGWVWGGGQGRSWAGVTYRSGAWLVRWRTLTGHHSSWTFSSKTVLMDIVL